MGLDRADAAARQTFTQQNPDAQIDAGYSRVQNGRIRLTFTHSQIREMVTAMPSWYFYPERGNLALASTFLRRLGIVLVAIAIGATAGVSVVVSLIAASGVDTSISARHALINAAPVMRPPAASPALVISFPASEAGVLQRGPGSPSGSEKSGPEIAAASEPTHIQAGAVIEPAPSKRRAPKPKKHHAGNRWRSERIRQRLGLVDRLKPQ